jgi:hypothetical protein
VKGKLLITDFIGMLQQSLLIAEIKPLHVTLSSTMQLLMRLLRFTNWKKNRGLKNIGSFQSHREALALWDENNIIRRCLLLGMRLLPLDMITQ